MTPRDLRMIDCQRLLAWLETPACTVSLPDTIVEANPAFAELCHVPPEQLAGQSLLKFLPEVDTAEFGRRLAQETPAAPLAVSLADASGPLPMLLRILATAESPLRVVALTPLENDIHRPLPFSHRAIVEYQAFMANAPVGIGYSKNKRIVRYNDKFGEIFGFAGDSGIGQPTTALYPSEEAYLAVAQRAFPLLAAGRSFREEMEMRRQDGSVFWADAVAYLVDPADPPQGSIWIISDISDRKAAQDTLDDTLLELQAIIDNASVGMVFTRNRQIQRCNRRFEEIFGYGPGELDGQPGIAIYDSQQSYEALGREAGPLLAAGNSFQSELQYKRKDGSLIWCRIYAKAVDPANKERGTVWITEDVTDTHATREALHQLLREMEAIMANASVGILITKDRKLVRYNARFGEMFGYSGESGVGRPARELYRSDEEYGEIGREAGPLLSQAKPFQKELFMRRQDGSDQWTNLIGYVADPEDTTRGTFWILEDRSAYKQSEEALHLAYAEQKLIFDHSVVGIAFVKHRVVQRCNRRFEEIYGWGPGELAGQPTRVMYLNDQSHAAVGEAAYAALGRGETYVGETIHLRRDGEPFWVRITGKAIDPARPNDGSIWNYEDITARKAAEESLRESEMLQRAILDSASLMILSTDATGRIVSCNPATEQMLGIPRDDLLGRTPTGSFFVAEELAARRQAAEAKLGYAAASDLDALLASVRLGSVEQGEWIFRRANGERFAVELSISSLHHGDDGAAGFLFVASDITERKRAEEELLRSRNELEIRVKERTVELESEVNERRRAENRLRYLALHDALTGLPNRNLLQQRIRDALELASGTDRQVAVLFIDLDRFKTINDSLGHHVGDALLKKVAHRLTAALRSDDTVARIGGDEFVIVAPVGDGEERATGIAEKILAALHPSFRIDRHELFVTPSIGICLFPRDGSTVDSLMRNADTAMYQAKAAGRNTYCYFQPAMNAAADNYFQIESNLRRAIERDEFEVHYQPIVAVQGGHPEALEALVRWRHPTQGLVPPGQFITVAEESGLIGQIGTLVLRSACRQVREWLDAGYRPPRIAINLSPIQFRDPDLIGDIVCVVEEFALTPDHIELEITETALMQDGELTLTTLDRLSKLGFKLSVDDFGTGYSSLAYLKRFPVDTLKIDRSFITDMTENDDDRAIVTAILALAHSLRLSVIAEGVETKAQFAALASLGCDQAQGYLISRPVPASDIAARYFGANTAQAGCAAG